LKPDLVDGILQIDDVGAGEAPTEVAGGRGIGDALGTQGIQERLIVAPLVDVFEAGAVAQGVVGDVQDMVGLVIDVPMNVKGRRE
jgi:hypothetical protein